MKYLTIYKTTHLPSGRFYIGRHVTKNPDDSYMGSGVVISSMLKKYPKEEFRKEILKFCEDLEDLTLSEIEFIQEAINTPLCMNLMVGDPRITGAVLYSEETRRKRSALMKGRTFSEESKRKMSESKKKTHNTPEVRRRLSEAQQNRSEETRYKLGSANRGKKISQEIRDKLSATISGAGNPRAKEWKICFEDGSDSIIVKSAKTWCQKYGVKYTTLYMKMKRGDLSFHCGVRIESF